jgi:hypothetical protein
LKASGQISVVRVEIPSIEEAAEKYIADAEARNLNSESLKKARDAIERLFLGFFCTKRGYRLLKQLGVDSIREFRNSLMKRYAASSAQTRLGYDSRIATSTLNPTGKWRAPVSFCPY